MNRKAAIIGGGVIGGGWAARFLLNGWDVAVCDPDPQAESKIGEVLDNARRSLPSLFDFSIPREGRITFVSSVGEAVQTADWIQESVPERLELKHAVFARIQAKCDPEALLGSSTSGFRPTELQDKAARPEQIFVAHPFNPVYLLPLVELAGSQGMTARAKAVLEGLGMKPLVLRKEIDAHIADRLLEAVWRESLWLVKDGIASTTEIDDAIRFGFGLRWAQMGLFETYRIAGGVAGMRHFLAQFGPFLSAPWTKLVDVPEFNEELVDLIADQSDLQSGEYSIRELERIRDDNLVAIMRALKARNWGVGQLLAEHETRKLTPLPDDFSKPITTLQRTVPTDWTDYNGHMNESRYGQVFSDAADRILDMIGAGQAYVDAGFSFFTVETRTTFLNEVGSAEAFHVITQALETGGKKLRLHHAMVRSSDGKQLATCNQLLIHVSLKTRRSCEPHGTVARTLAEFGKAQAKLAKPAAFGG